MEQNKLKETLTAYICERRKAESLGPEEDGMIDDYTQGCHDGVIMTLNDIEEILNKF